MREPTASSESPSKSATVRPSLLLFAALFLAVAGFTGYQLLDGGPESRGGELTAHERAERARARRLRSGRADRGSGGSSARGAAGAVHHGPGYQRHDWSDETPIARAMALGLPDVNFWRSVDPRELHRRDPQLAAMWRSFRGSINENGDAPELPFEPTAHRAELVEYEGDVPANPESCDVRVLPVASGSFNCVVRVTCDGQVLYPDGRQRAGYVPCEVENGRPVRGSDTGFSESDGDPLVSLDLERGTVTVEDFEADGTRRYRATLRING